MTASDIVPALLHGSPHFLCRNLNDGESAGRYRVPVVHRPLTNFMLSEPDSSAGGLAMDALPDLPSTRQLRALLQQHAGLGLWVSEQLAAQIEMLEPGTIAYQASAGSLLVYPPAEWESLREDFADWQFDGVDAAFEGLPYGFDDILPFAGPNFSPDRWFLVLRGSMAGRVFWWSHDGDSQMSEPWADDIKAWGHRICAEVPEIFGGVIRFAADDSIDPAPDGAVLLPVEYQSDA